MTSMSDGFDKALVHDLASIARDGLTFIRTMGAEGRADLCAVEADHLHDLPVVMKSGRWELLEHYLRLQRRRYVEGLAALGRKTWLDGLAWGRLEARLAEHGARAPSNDEGSAPGGRAATVGCDDRAAEAGFDTSLRDELLDLLGRELLQLRAFAWQGRADLCFLAADHLHNLPMAIANESWGALAYYNDCFRPDHRRALEEHGLAPSQDLRSSWDTITAHLLANDFPHPGDARSDR